MSDDNSETTNDTTEVNSILPGFIAGSFLAKFIMSLLLVLLLVGAVSAVTFAETSGQLTDNVEQEYIGIADQSASQVENWQEARGDTAIRLSGLGDIESDDPEVIQQRINEEMLALPDDVSDVHYMDVESGEIFATSRGALLPVEQPDGSTDFDNLPTAEAPWLGEVQYGEDDELFISEPVQAVQQSNVYFISPVDVEGDGPYGVNEGQDRNIALVMQSDLDSLAGDLGTNEENQFTQIVNDGGQIVAGAGIGDDEFDPDAPRIDAGVDSFEDYVEGDLPDFIVDGLEGNSGFVDSFDREGALEEEHAAGYASIQGQELVAVTHVPSAQAFTLRETITTSLAILVATVLLGFIVIGFTFGRGTVKALNRLTSKAEELESGNLETDLTVQRADEFGRLTGAFASMRDSLRDRIQEAEHSRREAEIARTEAEQLAEYLEEKAEEYSDIMQQVSSGDLTQQMETDDESEAMDRIATEFNHMVSELEKTVGQLQTFSDEVMESSEFVLSSTESIRRASEDVADSAQLISDDAHEQQDQLREVIGQLETIIGTFEQLESENPDLGIESELGQFRDLKADLESASETSDDLLTETENVAGAAEEQAAELNEVSARADRLKRYAQPLGEIVNKFNTDEEHEFVFSTGPTESPTGTDDD